MAVDAVKDLYVPQELSRAVGQEELPESLPRMSEPVETVHLRRAGLEDAAELALVGAATFLEAFTWMLPGPDIVAHCARHHTPEAYQAYLRSGSTRIHLATTGVPRGYPPETRGVAVGYAMLARPELPSFEVLPSDIELKRIYVFSRFRRSPVVAPSGEASPRAEDGVGGFSSTPRLPAQALLETAIQDALAMGYNRLLLGTHAGNQQAIRFYRRNGFEAVGTRTFQVGSLECHDLIFAHSLVGRVASFPDSTD